MRTRGRHILLAMSFYHAQLHKGVARFAAEHGWRLNSKMTINQQMPYGWSGDGAIIQGAGPPGYNTSVKELGVPLACMGRSRLGCPCVQDDFGAIAKAAADYYLGRGFKSFAVHNEQTHSMKQELGCFKEIVEAAGFPCAVLSTLAGPHDWSAQGRSLAEELSRLPKPVAVLARRDHAGAEVIDACIEHDISVPTDVAVMGIHNNELICNALSIPLSSVDNNLELMGYMAADLLNRVLDGEDVPKETLVPVKGVVTRASTDILAIDHPKVRRALMFIHENFRDPIGLAEIAQEAGMSVRGLQHAFGQAVGRTVNAEIIRLRVKLAKELLLTTDSIVETVGLDAGFQSMRNFHKLFKKATAQTPKQFRLANSSMRRSPQ